VALKCNQASNVNDNQMLLCEISHLNEIFNFIGHLC
jgi:hypothetical protein